MLFTARSQKFHLFATGNHRHGGNVKIILILLFEYLFSEIFLKSIDKFVKIIYNKVKGKIITTVMLPLKQSLS